MAIKKISDLGELTAATGSEEFLINDAGTSKKITRDNLLKNFTAPGGTLTDNLDVTGTVTADGLTVNSTSAQNVILRDDDAFSGADNQIKLAIAPSVSDGDSAGIAFGTYSNNDYWKQGIFWQRSGSYGIGDLIFANRESVDTTTVSDADQRLRIASNGDISFYEDTGTTAKFFWDASAERLGIGTTSPSDMLHVNGNGKFNNIAFGGYLSPYGDDTYINMLGSGRIQFRTNGSERMRIDSSGNMGLGVTPESWQSNITAFDLPSGGLSAYSTSHTYLSNNAYNDSSWKYKNTAHASLLTMVNGAYTFDVASSGTAGATIASTGGWTTAMTIDNSGNVGIGTSSPSVKLHASGADEQIFQISKTASGTPAMKVNGGYIITEGGNYGIRGGAGTAMYVGSNNADRAMFTTDGYMRFLAGTGGIQFNGDTAAANALDDYEEGTWTPTLYGSSSGTVTWGTVMGDYTKIGNLVTIRFTMINPPSNTSIYGDWRIGGMPFNTTGTSGIYIIGQVGHRRSIPVNTNGTTLVLFSTINKTWMNLTWQRNNTSEGTHISGGQCSASTLISGVMTYTTND